ncbi:MAG: phospholipase D-like domain-containing protein [Gammaproteobacteria bacterium]|nr:phospholipase D-like domain-containing protein [Gammaproteobacteria bacterium]
MRFGKLLASIALLLSLIGCASKGMKPPCPAGSLDMPGCPAESAVEDEIINSHYDKRTWVPASRLQIDTVQIGLDAQIPIQSAYAKILGPDQQDSLRSLAAKIWMIEQAQHTVDASYYIFSRDLVGSAILGALCNAVKRGVDVRLVVDSVGSFHPTHSDLKALHNCSAWGGFMRNASGELTTRRARAQVVVFNALSKVFVSFNRRSHDKLLVVDGLYPDKAMVMTGGRNISLDYYGITADGEPDPKSYKDVEIVLKPGSGRYDEAITVGSVSEHYLSLLFLHRGNIQIGSWFAYKKKAADAQQALRKIKGFAEFARYYAAMPAFMRDGFAEARVRLAHELGNLESEDVVEKYSQNLARNPNSIVGNLGRLGSEAAGVKEIRIVSPYLFLPQYTSPTGKVLHDGKLSLDAWLAEDPERSIEIVTNSVMTSDNFLAQSIIDMDMAPRLLLSDDLLVQWLDKTENGELNPALVESAQWQRQVSNPRIKIYQSGRLDSKLVGGDTYYGKLHAKFMIAGDIGFVGTTNLDYRSRLYNNEMGFFLHSEQLGVELNATFDELKAKAYLWGSPEWLEMRKRVRALDGQKGRAVRRQRKIYTQLLITGLKWQI